MNGDGTARPDRETATIVISADDMSAEITIQGQRHVVHGENAKETRRAALDHVTAYAAHIGHSVLIEARDAYSTWRLEASPSGVVRGLPGAPVGRGRSGRLAVVVAGVLAAVLVVVVGIIVRQAGGSEPTVAHEEATATTETVAFEARPAPPGFSTEAAWRIPIAPETQPDVAEDGSRIVFISVDERLAVAGPDGGRLWESDLPLRPEEIQGRVRFVRQGVESHVALTGPSTLWIWPPGGGEPEEYELSKDALVTFAGTAPLITEGTRAMIAENGRLVPVEAPEEAGGMLVHGSKVLMAAADGPWYWSAPDDGPEKVSAERPEGAEELERVITASENHVIVRWRSEKKDRVVLAVHDAHDGSVTAAAQTTAGELADASWIEGAGVAAYGPVLVDLESGNSQVLSGFSPLSATGDTVYGELEDAKVAVDADGETTRMEPDTARPWGLLGGNAVVLADNNLYSLFPE